MSSRAEDRSHQHQLGDIVANSLDGRHDLLKDKLAEKGLSPVALREPDGAAADHVRRVPALRDDAGPDGQAVDVGVPGSSSSACRPTARQSAPRRDTRGQINEWRSSE